MILALESSTPRASLALFDPAAGAVVWSRAFTSVRAHNAMIFEPLAESLDRCGRRLDLIAVGLGPGSYSGVRVGLAVAHGLAVALGAPVIGLSSLEAMHPDEKNYAVIGDARRQSWFVARVEHGVLAGEPALTTEEGLIADLTLLHRNRVAVFTADPVLAARFPNVAHRVPEAALLAGRAAALDAETVARLAAGPIEPHYLRAPYITTPRG